ncbi:hypothetical protein PLEOSDRAFT_168644 [Pleurotus ostreatus PC15]|uniref:Uncharacterized protein n=1 Tax=Pleurotus ostreatus (strain PC15) TaxID=1137138 RepID=A0A067NGX7_PLEO1|nr:hypothetical protein PLEOSDRAFT_168644 [Pleurotus ostreatus PC15]
MSRRLSHPPAMYTTTLPPFSNLIQHERVEWHRNSPLSSMGQPTPSSSPLDLRHPHLGDDSGGSSISSSDDYQYGARPRQTQPPTSLSDFRYRQHIPDAVVEPSLREPHTSRSRSQHNERSSTQYEQDRSTFAQAFGPMRVAPREQYETPHTYPPVRREDYNGHNYIFCPGEKPPPTASFLGVQIENKVDTSVMREYDREHRYIDTYPRYNEGTRIDWHRHEPTTSATWSPSHTSRNNSRHLPIQPQVAAIQVTKISAGSTSSSSSALRQERRSVDWLHGRSTSPTPSPAHRSQNSSDSGHLHVRHQALPTEATDMHEYARDHRFTDPYARYNEGTRIDWHRHETRTSAPWSPKYTSPNSSRRLPIQPQAPVTQTTRVPTSPTSWPPPPPPPPHEGRSVDWLHHRSTTSAPLSPTHTSQNASGLGCVPVRRRSPPIKTIDAASTPPSEWASSASPYGVQCSPTASSPRRFEVDKSYPHQPRSQTPYHRTPTFEEPLSQPPKGSNNICPYPSEPSLRPSPSGRDRECDEDRYEMGTYGRVAGARTIADYTQARVSGDEIGRHNQKDTAAPSVAEIGLEVGGNTERPVAKAPRASSSGTTTTTRPGIIESTTEASVTVEDVRTAGKEASEVVKDPREKSKQQNPRRSTKGMKRGSLLMEWTGPEPPVPLPPIKSWGRAGRSTKTATSKAWRVDVNAVPRVETEPEAERRGDSTLRTRDTPGVDGDHAEIRKNSTKKRKGDHDGQSTSIGTTEEGSRAGGSQSQGTQRPRPKPRKKQKTSSPATEVAQSSSSLTEVPVRRGPPMGTVHDHLGTGFSNYGEPLDSAQRRD